jgi:hypothetical protein
MGDSGMAEEPKQEDRDAQGIEDDNREGNPNESFLQRLIRLSKYYYLTNLLTPVSKFVLGHHTFVVSLLYLYVTAYGMLYSWSLYRTFGINIFDYSEVGDFLLIAFKYPGVLLLTGLQIIFALFSLPFGEIAERMGSPKNPSPADKYSWGTKVGALFVCIFIAAGPLLVYANASYTASDIKDGQTPGVPDVDVQYRAFSSSAGQVKKSGLEHIGATQKATFFYDADAVNKRTIVIPQAQIVSIEVPE